MNWDDLLDRYNNFIEFDSTSIDDRLPKINYEVGYFQNIFYTLKNKHSKLMNDYDNLWQERYMYYKYDFDLSLSSSEIKQFIEKDSEMNEIKHNIRMLENKINQTEDILKNIDNMRWSIKSLIDWENFKAGNFK